MGAWAKRGFTLVELLVTLAVVGVLVAALYQIFVSQQRAHTVQEEVADAQQNARVSLQEITGAVASLGAGVDLERGQTRILVAHPYQIVFNADLDLDPGVTALLPGQNVPGHLATDPYQQVPAGTFDQSPASGAETYRYTLDGTRDGRVTAADRTQGEHYSLYREKSYGTFQGNKEEIARLVANPRINEPLFRYRGDFNAVGHEEVVDRVDASTSSRVAAGEPLDAVIRKIEVNLVTETANPDPRYPRSGGYRQTRLRTVLSPENLWDCPVVAPTSIPAPLRLPLPATTTLEFRVTRGGAAEEGRSVYFTAQDPAGGALAVTSPSGTGNRGVTDASGHVSAVIQWPSGCSPLGNYTLRARTGEPPTLDTPYGTCSPQEATVTLTVIEGTPGQVTFAPATLSAESCGGSGITTYTLRDACGHPARAEDVPTTPDAQISLALGPDPTFGSLTTTRLGQPEGTVGYRSPTGSYGGFAVTRSATPPNPFQAQVTALQGARIVGNLAVAVPQVPYTIGTLTRNAVTASLTDCPNPVQPVQDTFSVEDSCGNPLPTLLNTGAGVTAQLVRSALPGWPVPDQGLIASPGNRAALAADPVTIVQHDGTAGEFAVQYQAPTCTISGFTFFPQLTLTPTWPGGSPQTLPLTLEPCGGCSVEVLDRTGASVTHLNKECDGQSRLVVTECVPAGTTAEVVIGRVSGTGMLSFDRNRPSDRVTLTFNQGTRGQTATSDLFIGSARTGDQFRIAAFIPNQAAVQTGHGVLCQGDLLTVDTRCSQILVSATADNPAAVPQNLAPEDTPLCGADGSAVYFRVEDCDQNLHSNLFDDIRWTAGGSTGLVVEVLDGSTGEVLDREGPNLLESDIHGTRNADSPYFQGTLTVTSDPSDGNFSGRLRAPQDRPAVLRARYTDPTDPADNLCLAQALLVPPLPVCLSQPLLSDGDWAGPLLVHWGDATVSGGLALPGDPVLVAKAAAAPLDTSPYGADAADRFFDAYVGGQISVGATPLPPLGPMDQPFLPAGSGAPFAADRGNYFQAVPDASSLFPRLDYEALKQIAQARRAYWVTQPDGTLLNPATLRRGTFEQVTALPGPGIPSATYDGRFLFVDAPEGLQGGGRIDQTPLAQLPVHEVTGPYYTEGFLYVAGSVVFASPRGGQSVPFEAPSVLDARYDESSGGFSRSDLPIDFVQPLSRANVGAQRVNIHGALYCDGQVTLPAGFRVYGAVAAERGGHAGGAAEIWYDTHWREAQLSLCANCCSLAVAPSAPRLSLTDTLRLTSSGARGAVVWESLAPQVAAVDQTGLVTPAAVGTVTIRATDAGGCVAEATVEVL